MTDLIQLMSKLVDQNGNILIPGVEEMVSPPDQDELCVPYLFCFDPDLSYVGNCTR